MTTHYLTPEQGSPMARKFYPAYTGQKFAVTVAESYQFNDYWDGGSREYATLAVCDALGELRSVASPTGIVAPWNKESHTRTQIPVNGMVIAHSIFLGKDMGITFYVSPGSVFLPKMLPANTDNDTTTAEKSVLYATRCYKNSYSGRNNIREDEACCPRYGARHPNGISVSRQEYRAAREELIRKGYLNKAGALTVSGRNAAQNIKNFPKE